jgi:hypothetical protein
MTASEIREMIACMEWLDVLRSEVFRLDGLIPSPSSIVLDAIGKGRLRQIPRLWP